MDIEKRIEIIKRNTEEILTEQDLRSLLEKKIKLKHYIGFEISGFIHLGTGLVCMGKVKDFQEAGIDCSIFLADWHSWINDKLGGNMDAIKKIAAGYFKEGLKASLKCVGGNPNKVKFVLGSDLYHNNDKYWQSVIEISKHITLARTMRSITIMGRKEGETVDFAKLIYPPMQAADIFTQGINIASAGLDQRSAHVIAREVAEKLKVKPLMDGKKKYSPVAVHHHLLLGLQKPLEWPVPKERLREIWSSMKMSKSLPNSAVFIHDGPEEIKSKISKAFCQQGETDFNPVLDWAKTLIFRDNKNKFKIERDKKFGGDLIFNSYDELENTFAKGTLHPMDLKNAVAESLIKILEPARKHFKKPNVRKMKEELENLKVTR